MSERGSLFSALDPPVFVDGIGPPLQQIEQDLRESQTGYAWSSDALALIAEIVRLRAELRRIAEADLPPDRRPAASNWSPSFWKWAPKVARKAIGMKPYNPRWGWNDL